ncbi:MAG: NAD(P)H-hydrate dehydratase [Bdellovibrionales bacterium]|nr:NAD(P)H-hydrate dehydratase [Bdellovibrionales bacterium]
MRLLTVDQCREVDSISCKVYGLTDEILMESAGIQSARECQQNFYPELTRGLTVIVCGPGNNGGDGLVMARHLHSMGFRNILVMLAAPKTKRSAMFKIQLKRAELHGLRIVDAFNEAKKSEQIRSATLIVDALFGIGLKSKIEGEFRSLVDQMNALKVPTVSLDCPSGLNCNTGIASEVAIKAHTTFTFGLPKPGFFTADGPSLVGKLRVLSVGYPYECLRGVATTNFVFNDKLARRYLPARKERSNKSDFGRLVVIAGSENMWGAGILAAQSAYRMGTGYVIWAANDIPVEKLELTPEVLTTSLDSDEVWDLRKINAYAIGPGLGVGDETAKIIRKLKSLKAEKVILDADAITACVKYKLFPLPKSWVVTPHAAELSRIIKVEVKQIESDRFRAALLGAEKTGCHVLLKGYRSILAYEDRCMVINAGNSALAKAGSGDVLTGMIGGLLAQGSDTLQATATAAYVHGRIADDWVRMGFDKRSLQPSDLKEGLSSMLSRITQGVVF